MRGARNLKLRGNGSMGTNHGTGGNNFVCASGPNVDLILVVVFTRKM